MHLHAKVDPPFCCNMAANNSQGYEIERETEIDRDRGRGREGELGASFSVPLNTFGHLTPGP